MHLLSDITCIYVSGAEEISTDNYLDSINVFVTGLNLAGNGLEIYEDCFVSGSAGLFIN